MGSPEERVELILSYDAIIEEEPQQLSLQGFEKLRQELCVAVREEITACMHSWLGSNQEQDSSNAKSPRSGSPSASHRTISAVSVSHRLPPSKLGSKESDQIESPDKTVWTPPLRPDSGHSFAVSLGGGDEKRARDAPSATQAPAVHPAGFPSPAMVRRKVNRDARQRRAKLPNSGATVYEIEQQLASELFQARELEVPKPKKDEITRIRSTSSVGATPSFNWRQPKDFVRQIRESFVRATTPDNECGRAASSDPKVAHRAEHTALPIPPPPCDREAPQPPHPSGMATLDFNPVTCIPSAISSPSGPLTAPSAAVSTEATLQISNSVSARAIQTRSSATPHRQVTGRVPTFVELRRMQDEEITKSIDLSDELELRLHAKASTPTAEWSCLFRKWVTVSRVICRSICPAVGVTPWSEQWQAASHAYQLLVFVIAVLNAGIAVAVTQVRGTTWSFSVDDEEIVDLFPFLNVVLSMGAVFGLLSCGVQRRSVELVEAAKLVRGHCLQVGLTMEKDLPCCDVISSSLTWILALLAMGLVARVHEDCWMMGTFVQVSFALSMAVLVALCHRVTQSCRRLARMIDHFCYTTVLEADFHSALTEWNVLQALCRRSCNSVQLPFLVLQMTATALVLLSVNQMRANDVGRLMMSLPGLPAVLLVFRTSVWAARVTDKCVRVPMIVNGVVAAEDMDLDRLYVVQYIKESQAGFYLFELRLTSATVLKMAYISCAGCFFLTTRFF